MSNITGNVKNITIRNASITCASQNFGFVGEVKAMFKPIVAGKDSKGRTIVNGVLFEASWEVLQNRATELEALADSQLNNALGSLVISLVKTGEGITIADVKPYYDFNLDMAGGVSKIIAKVDKILSLSEFLTIVQNME